MNALLTNAVLAHQGGWDEILLVAAPIVVFAALLFVANRRAGAMTEDTGDSSDTDEAAESTKKSKK